MYITATDRFITWKAIHDLVQLSAVHLLASTYYVKRVYKTVYFFYSYVPYVRVSHEDYLWRKILIKLHIALAIRKYCETKELAVFRNNDLGDAPMGKNTR